MKILGIFLQNYGAFHGRHYIPLADRGLVSVWGQNLDDPRSRSNGAGKSTWSDALDWALFGEVPRGDAAHTVVNEEAGKNCCVTVLISDDNGHLLQITRLRDYLTLPNGPRFWIDGQEQTLLDAKATQQLIERHLGMDRVVCHAAVIFSQNAGFKFADASDGERKDILARILPELAEVDGLLEHITRKGGLMELANAALMTATAATAAQAAALAQMQARDWAVEMRTWEESRQQRLQAAMAEALRLATARDAAAQARNQVGAVPALPPAPPAMPPPPGHAEAFQRYAAVDATSRQLSEQLAVLRQRTGEKAEARKRLAGVQSGPCSQCGQMVTREHLEAELRTATAAHAALVAEGTAVRAQYDAVQIDLRAAGQARDGLDEQWRAARQQQATQHAAACAGISAQQSHAASLDRVWRDAEAALQRAHVFVATVDAEVSPLVAVREQWRLAEERAAAALGQARQTEAAAQLRVQGLEFWKIGLGAKGLKSYVLDSKVADMAREANRWVQHLTGGTVWVQFSTQREVGRGKSRKLVEDFSISVFRSNPDGTVTERNYRSWSGGEKYRIAMGIDFGLTRLIAKRASRAYDLLILDEVFGRDLDASGKEAVAEMLAIMGKDKSSLYVIDHDVQFQNMFDGRMLIRKKMRRSAVVDGVSLIGTEATGGGEMLANHSAFPS